MNQCTKKKRTKRQHIISRLYLKNFSVDEKVWVIDFHSDLEPYRTNIVNALCISNFYTISTKDNEKDDLFEKNFSRVETEVKPILDRLLKEKMIPEGRDKEKLVGYLACLFLIGPRFRQICLEFYESYHKLLQTLEFSKEAVFDKFWQEHLRNNAETTLTKDLARKFLDESVVEGYINRESYIMAFLRELQIVEPLFGKMSIKVLWGNPSVRPRFITGDFPFVFQDKSNMKYGMPAYGGLLNKNARIYIPLSPLVCLMLEYERENAIYSITSREFIPEMNSQLALAVSRYVISGSEEIYWFKNNKIRTSADELHSEFYPRKLEEPIIIIDSPSYKKTTIARRSWNKLKGDKPPVAKR